MPEVIPIGADHAGFELKRRLLYELRALGFEPLDLGTDGPESTDYPDYAHQVASRVEHHEARRDEARRGVLLCGTGLGMSYWACRTRPAAMRACERGGRVAKIEREHG
jgi:ribose 5-phosphate isomerase B